MFLRDLGLIADSLLVPEYAVCFAPSPPLLLLLSLLGRSFPPFFDRNPRTFWRLLLVLRGFSQSLSDWECEYLLLLPKSFSLISTLPSGDRVRAGVKMGVLGRRYESLAP